MTAQEEVDGFDEWMAAQELNLRLHDQLCTLLEGDIEAALSREYAALADFEHRTGLIEKETAALREIVREKSRITSLLPMLDGSSTITISDGALDQVIRPLYDLCVSDCVGAISECNATVADAHATLDSVAASLSTLRPVN